MDDFKSLTTPVFLDNPEYILPNPNIIKLKIARFSLKNEAKKLLDTKLLLLSPDKFVDKKDPSLPIYPGERRCLLVTTVSNPFGAADYKCTIFIGSTKKKITLPIPGYDETLAALINFIPGTTYLAIQIKSVSGYMFKVVYSNKSRDFPALTLSEGTVESIQHIRQLFPKVKRIADLLNVPYIRLI